jgi:biotin carboxyl carrier protein
VDGPLSYRVEVGGRQFDVTIAGEGAAYVVEVTATGDETTSHLEGTAGADASLHRKRAASDDSLTHRGAAAGDDASSPGRAAAPAARPARPSPAASGGPDAAGRADTRWLATWQGRTPHTYTLGLQPLGDGGSGREAEPAAGWFGDVLVSAADERGLGDAGAADAAAAGSAYWVALGGYQEPALVVGARAWRLAAALPRRAGAAIRLDVRAPMPGRVVSVRVAVGALVERGDLVITLEAMKMENELRAAGPGRVQAVHVREGDTVEHGALLLVLAPLDDGGGAPARGDPG